jgi:S-formylglutathione hydrolase FrmB
MSKLMPRIICLAILLAGLAVSFVHAQAPAGLVVDAKVASAALEGNRLGDTATRNVSIYLPPSYRSGERRYPVLYLLPGFFGTNRTFQSKGFVDAPALADKAFAQSPTGEFIIVMPDARNFYGGSFYTDSAAAGDWETFLVRELVSYVDSEYRTLRDPAARGLAGHSMGGYAALKQGMKHPDVFGAVYALSPCCMDWGKDLSLENPAWKDTLSFRTVEDFQAFGKEMRNLKDDDPTLLRRFFSIVFMALAAAWSPAPAKPPLYVDLPVEPAESGWRPVPGVQARWSANLILPMAPQYRGNLRRLRAIVLDVGRQEEFEHILTGSHAFSRLLTEYGIAHTFEEYEGDHSNRIPQRLEEKVLPFFLRVFAEAKNATIKAVH